MDRERLDNWLEKGILGLVLAILAYAPLATGGVLQRDQLVVQGLTLGVLLLWLVRALANGEHRLLWPPVCWLVVVFVGYAYWRYRAAGVEYFARTEFIQIAVYAALFFAVVNNLNRTEPAQVIIFALFALAVAISGYAIYQYLAKSNQVWNLVRPPQYAGRGSGTFIGPNAFAGFLGLILPLAVAYTVMGRVGHATRIGIGYAAVVLMAGIGVSASRGGIIAALVGLILLIAVLVRKPGWRIPAFVVLGLVLASGVWFLSTAQYTQQRFQKAGAEADFRFTLWEPARKMWLDRFWTGFGPAQFNQEFPAYRTEALQIDPEFVHNDYLNTLVDYGLVGTLLVAGVWVLALWGAVRIWKFAQRRESGSGMQKSNRAALVLGTSVSLVVMLLHAWVDFNMHVPGVALVAVVWLGLLTGHWRLASDRFWAPAGWVSRGSAVVLALAGLGFLAMQGWQGWREYSVLRQVHPRRTPISEQIAVLKRAHEVEPQNPQTVMRLGELHRQLSWQGNPSYEREALEAIKWFALAAKLNPRDPYPPMYHGMCLDWIEQVPEGEKYFKRALELDPVNSVVLTHQGWHLLQKDDSAGAKAWIEKALKLRPNPMADMYYKVANERLKAEKGNP